MLFYSEADRPAGGITVFLTSPPIFTLVNCSRNQKPSSDLSLLHQKVWTFYRKGNQINVKCNERAVLSVELSSEVCSDDSTWRIFWEKDVAKLLFTTLDNASEKFRAMLYPDARPRSAKNNSTDLERGKIHFSLQ